MGPPNAIIAQAYEFVYGPDGKSRTYIRSIKSRVLCQLSYIRAVMVPVIIDLSYLAVLEVALLYNVSTPL